MLSDGSLLVSGGTFVEGPSTIVSSTGSAAGIPSASSGASVVEVDASADGSIASLVSSFWACETT